MPIGNVTIDWKITTDVAGTIPATGKVRWHLPRVVLTDEVIAGLAPTPWVDLVAGAGSITIPDPWDALIAPQGWAPVVEIQSNAINARYGVYIPEGKAGQTLDLHKLSSIPDSALGDVWALVNHTHEGGGGAAPDATTTTKGIVKLAGDLGGTADLPTVPGLATKQPLDPDLTTIAGLTPTANDVLQYVSGAWANRTIGQLKTSLALTYADFAGTVPTSALPPLAINETFVVADQAAMLALAAQRGDMAIRSDNGRTYVLSSDSPGTLADWKEVLAAGQVQSVAGKTGVVTLAKADVGLGAADNTADVDKPISTATQNALNQKRQPVNPLERWNLKGASGDPFAFQGGVGIGSGMVWGSLVYVPAGEAINNLWAAVRGEGTYSASAVPNQIGAWTEAGVPIGNTANDDTLWSVAGWRGGAVVGGPIAAQSIGRWIYMAWIVGGYDVVNFPFPASAVDANAVWFAFGPGITRRGAFYIAGGQTALPGTFDPTTIGTATTSVPLLGFN